MYLSYSIYAAKWTAEELEEIFGELAQVSQALMEAFEAV